MALVTHADGRKVKVKNLGWLLSHAYEITSIRCTHFTEAERRENGGADARLTAWLSTGAIFETLFASRNVLTEWVKRKSLRHVKVETYYAGTTTEG